jgi:hypothetical protein
MRTSAVQFLAQDLVYSSSKCSVIHFFLKKLKGESSRKS